MASPRPVSDGDCHCDRPVSACQVPAFATGEPGTGLSTPGSSFRGRLVKEVTRILSDLARGDRHAAEQLLPLVYDELRRLATQKLAQEKPGQTLQATALVHEAYLRLVEVDPSPDWNSRGHFFAAAAEAMRRLLIENARRKGRRKRGGDLQRCDIEVNEPTVAGADTDVLAVDEALIRLAAEHPEKAELVKLRYFAGLTLTDAASALGISIATAGRHWRYARAWLARELRARDTPGPE
jgi:RNA polymerase sigma factor (TIGR02999 family)